MAQPFALQNLLDIATSEADSAAAQLGALNRQLQAHEQKLAMLLQYRADYQQRLRDATAAGLDSTGLRNFNDFVSRLEQAIAQQQAAVGDARMRVEQGRQEWQNKRRKSKAFDTLSQRARKTLTRIENVRDQKLQDDFASRSARAKNRTPF